MSKLFNTLPIKFKYFVCKNIEQVFETMGYQFTADQYTSIQYGAFCDANNSAVYAGNGNEFYPHEVVHLYTASYWGKEGNYYHSWFEEGIATLFGGSMGLPLEWHLRKLKIYLEQNPEDDISDISKLSTIPNGEYMSEYIFTIGGLICKLTYEKKGMDGLFELLKSGYTDDDFYKAIEKQFKVKKENFNTFLRDELNKIQD
jgi:hypothetical protein